MWLSYKEYPLTRQNVFRTIHGPILFVHQKLLSISPDHFHPLVQILSFEALIK